MRYTTGLSGTRTHVLCGNVSVPKAAPVQVATLEYSVATMADPENAYLMFKVELYLEHPFLNATSPLLSSSHDASWKERVVKMSSVSYVPHVSIDAYDGWHVFNVAKVFSPVHCELPKVRTAFRVQSRF